MHVLLHLLCGRYTVRYTVLFIHINDRRLTPAITDSPASENLQPIIILIPPINYPRATTYLLTYCIDLSGRAKSTELMAD